MLSVLNEEETIVKALDCGADDYVTKPFGARELLARIRVCLRHQLDEVSNPLFKSGRLQVNLATRDVLIDDQKINLTVTEYDLLCLLVRNAGKVLTHKQIFTEIWGPHATDQLSNLRVYVTRLRQKIEQTQAGRDCC